MSPEGLSSLQRVVVLVFLSALCLFSLVSLRPPLRDDGEFSVTNALKHLEVIAKKPHPTQSQANALVRAYLVEQLSVLGWDVQVQESEIRRPGQQRTYRIANVLARLDGTPEGRAVLLAAHYDSVPKAPGAADDGAAVAALLEVARILGSKGALRNDVILLITDAEEAGLFGAQAFVQEHPWVGEVAVVLNFEARGTSGPSIMFESSRRNGWLIRAYASAAPHPVTSSVGPEVYRHMPNLTDFTVFTAAGLEGLNFAFIGSPENYHSPQDDLDHLSLRSLYHHGVQALSLARRFGNMDLAAPDSSSDAVFFSVLGLGVVHYSTAVGVVLGSMVVLLAAAALAGGVYFKKVSLKAIGLTAGSALVTLAGIAVTLLVITRFLNPASRIEPLSCGVLLLSSALSLAMITRLTRHFTIQEVCAGVSVWVALLAAATLLWVPTVSYLFVWPLACATLGAVLLSWQVPRGKQAVFAVVLLCAFPPIVLLLPITLLALIALGASSAFMLSILVLVLVWTLSPQLLLIRKWNYYVSVLLAAAGVGCFVNAG